MRFALLMSFLGLLLGFASRTEAADDSLLGARNETQFPGHFYVPIDDGIYVPDWFSMDSDRMQKVLNASHVSDISPPLLADIIVLPPPFSPAFLPLTNANFAAGTFPVGEPDMPQNSFAPDDLDDPQDPDDPDDPTNGGQCEPDEPDDSDNNELSLQASFCSTMALPPGETDFSNYFYPEFGGYYTGWWNCEC